MGRPVKKPVITNQLKTKVEVWQTVERENELGECEFINEKVRSVWASIVPQLGSMGDRANTQFATMTHKIITRYGVGKDIKPSYHFKYEGVRYDILYPLNPYQENITMEFFVKEIFE